MSKRKIDSIKGIIRREGRIIPIGNSLAVTLPRTWVDDIGLVKGDPIVKLATKNILTIYVERKG